MTATTTACLQVLFASTACQNYRLRYSCEAFATIDMNCTNPLEPDSDQQYNPDAILHTSLERGFRDLNRRQVSKSPRQIWRIQPALCL